MNQKIINKMRSARAKRIAENVGRIPSPMDGVVRYDYVKEPAQEDYITRSEYNAMVKQRNRDADAIVGACILYNWF